MKVWSTILSGTWVQRIAGGALVLALVSLSAPTITSARFNQDETPIEDPTPEEIYISDPFPSPTPQPTIAPFDTGTHTGAGAPNTAPSDGGGGGGPSSGEVTVQNWDTITLEEMMAICLRAEESSGDDPAFVKFLCKLALAAFACQYDLGGSFNMTMHVEIDTNENENEEGSYLVGYCDIQTQNAWMQVWYGNLVSGSDEPTEICTGAPGQTGTCFEP